MSPPFEGLGIYDLALLSECKQIFDPEQRTMLNLEVDVKGLESLRIPSGMIDYPELYNRIIALREEYEEQEYSD